MRLNPLNTFKLLKHPYVSLHRPCLRVNLIRNISSDRLLKPFTFSEDKDYNLRVIFKDFDFSFPSVWLRDNCQCERCFHPASKSRIINWKTFDVNIRMKSVVLTEDRNNISVKWSDGHISTYSFDWLNKRNFTAANQEKYLNEVYKPKRITWNKETFEQFYNKYDYQEIMNDNDCLHDWLMSLSIYGVALVTNVPASEESNRKLANRVEFLKKTHYGEEFIVKNIPTTTNVAYLPSDLQLHTDLPYYEYKPGVNMLHCYIQALGKGGDSLLSDGLYVANIMKEQHPESYKVLTTTQVNWEDYGQIEDNVFHSIHRAPVICVDDEGELTRINHSIPQRGSHFNVPLEAVKPWYQALKIFVDLIHEQSVEFKMSCGEILCFDNRRLVHGRKGYHDTQDNIRCIIGLYVDWDYIFSRIRVT